VPQPFLGSFPSELSPRRGSRAPLEAAGSLAVIHRRAGTRRPAPCHLRFHSTPTPSRSCRDPPQTMGSLFPSRSPSPGHPGHRTTEPLRSASFTYFEAFFPSSSPFAAASGRPSVAGRCSPGFPASSKLPPPTPRILDPPRAIAALRTRPHPQARTRDPEDLDPLSQVRRSLATKSYPRSLVGRLQPPSRLVRTASSAATPSLLALPARAHPIELTYRASKYAGSGSPPRRCLLP
jgi:hypothetical protein